MDGAVCSTGNWPPIFRFLHDVSGPQPCGFPASDPRIGPLS